MALLILQITRLMASGVNLSLYPRPGGQATNTLFILLSGTIEHDTTVNVLLNPKEMEAEIYVTDRCG